MQVFVIVFEDNMLEMIDSDMIFADRVVAETVKDNYTESYYSDGSRKPMVRPLQMNDRTAAKMRADMMR
jgi:hypothetical protein